MAYYHVILLSVLLCSLSITSRASPTTSTISSESSECRTASCILEAIRALPNSERQQLQHTLSKGVFSTPQTAGCVSSSSSFNPLLPVSSSDCPLGISQLEQYVNPVTNTSAWFFGCDNFDLFHHSPGFVLLPGSPASPIYFDGSDGVSLATIDPFNGELMIASGAASTSQLWATYFPSSGNGSAATMGANATYPFTFPDMTSDLFAWNGWLLRAPETPVEDLVTLYNSTNFNISRTVVAGGDKQMAAAFFRDAVDVLNLLAFAHHGFEDFVNVAHFYSLPLPAPGQGWGQAKKLLQFPNCGFPKMTMIKADMFVFSCSQVQQIFMYNGSEVVLIFDAYNLPEVQGVIYDRAWDTLYIMLTNKVLALQGFLLESTIFPYINAITLLSASVCRSSTEGGAGIVTGMDKITGQRMWGCAQGVIASTGITTRQLANLQPWSQLSFLVRDNLRDVTWIVPTDGGQFIYPLRGEVLGDPLPAALANPNCIAVDEITGFVFAALAYNAVIYDPRTGTMTTTAKYPGEATGSVTPVLARVCNQVFYVQIEAVRSSIIYLNFTDLSSVPQQPWKRVFDFDSDITAFYCHDQWVWTLEVTGIMRLFDMTNGTVVRTNPFVQYAGDLFLDFKRNMLFLNAPLESIAVFNCWQLTLVAFLPHPPWNRDASEHAFAVDERRGRMYIGGGNSDATWYFDYNITSIANGEWNIYLPSSECERVASLAFDPRTEVLHIACGNSGAIFAMSSHFACQSGSQWTGFGCTICPVGYARGAVDFNVSSRFIPQCQKCEQGFIAPDEGAPECTACEPGSAQIDPSSQTCVSCGVGTVQNNSAQIDCIPCTPGRYSNIVGGTQCLPCASGSFSGNFSADFCIPCAAGRFAELNAIDPTAGSSSCSDCVPGSIAATIGLTSCSACVPGRFAIANASSDCEVCARGSASNVTGLGTNCPVCNMGYEAPRFGQTACSACQIGYTSAVDGCTQCAPSTYTPRAGSPCVSCSDPDQVGLQCYAGLAFVQVGYWAWTVPDNTTGMTRFVTTPCPINYCGGSPLQQVSQSNGSTGNTTDIELCEWPRLSSPSNVMCGACVPGYLAWSNQCVSCSSTNGPLLFGFIILGFLLVLFLYATNTSSAGALSIGLYFVQVAQLQIQAQHTHLEWLGFVNLGAHSFADCIAPLSPVQQTLLTCATPLLLCGLLIVMGVFHRALLFVLKNTRTRIELKFPTARYIGTAVAILMFSYTSVSTGVMNALHCVDVGQDRVVFAMPSVSCRSHEYKHAFPYFITTIVVFVAGLPAILVAVLFINRQQVLRTLQMSSNEDPLGAAAMSASDITFDLRIGPAFRMYTARSSGFWQALLLLRRFAFVLVSVLLSGSSDTTLQFTLFGVLSFSGLLLHLLVKPFKSERLNQLETMAGLCLTYLALLLIASKPPHISVFSQVLINIIVLVPATIIFGIVAQNLVATCRERVSRAMVDSSKMSDPAEDHFPVVADENSLSYQGAAVSRNPSFRMNSVLTSPSLSRDDYVSMDQ